MTLEPPTQLPAMTSTPSPRMSSTIRVKVPSWKLRSVQEARPAVGTTGIRQHAGQDHPELAPDARLAPRRDLAAEEPHAPADEGESDAEAVVTARRRAVGLGEDVEDLLEPLGHDADSGVADGDDGGITVAGAHRDHGFAP